MASTWLAQRVEVKSPGGGARLIADCSLPSWVQRAPQLEQKASGCRLRMTMVMWAEAHSGQRGIGPLLACLVVAHLVAHLDRAHG